MTVLRSLVQTRMARPRPRVPAELSEHVAVLAHELATPIASIAAAAQALARECDGRAASRKASAIAQEAREAFALLECLGDLSALELGRLPMRAEPTDLVELVRSGVQLVDAPERRIVLELPDVPVIVCADARRIRQVLRNLLSNAAKYSPPRTDIEVRVGSLDAGAAYVRVRDHGLGIPPRERGRLFGKFVRLSTAGETRGSGLGLYLSRLIVEDHGGELGAEWPADGGSAFRFTLPLAEAGAIALPETARSA